jgi:hypothetical protein
MARIFFIFCLTLALLHQAVGEETPRVFGPYATQLSAADIEQIKIASNPSHERLTKIEAFRRNRVHVHTGTVATWTLVTLTKRDGRWIVDKKVVTPW